MKKFLLSLTLLLGLAVAGYATTDIYVHALAAGGGDGTSWSTALQAIPATIENDQVVHVAAGTYSPSASITVKTGCKLLGGYLATDGSRNYGVNKTIINGANVAAGSIVINSGGVVDGLIIEKSQGYNTVDPSQSVYKTGTGGGVSMNVAGAVLSNCIVRYCVAQNNGGGVYCTTNSTTIINCLIYDNIALGTALSNGASAVCAAASSTVNIVNCTLGASWLSAATSAVLQGLNATSTTFNLYNTIIVPPTSGNMGGMARAIINCYHSTLFDIATGNAGTVNDIAGNLAKNTNPLLNPDYTLATGSPCKEAGRLTYSDGSTPLFASGSLDLGYHPRMTNNKIDIGAYAFPLPGVSVSSNTVDFGQRTLGSTYTQTITVTPTALTADLALAMRGGSAFTVSPSSITQATSTAVEVTLTLDAAAAGTPSDVLEISGGGLAAPVEIAVQASVVSNLSPSLSTSTDAIAFGTVAKGSSHTATFTLTVANLTQDLSLAVEGTSAPYSVSPATVDKDPQGSRDITVAVTFAPPANADYPDALVITGSGFTKRIDLSGSASAPVLSTNPTASVAMGDVAIGKNKATILAVTGSYLTGNVALALSGTDAGMFALSSATLSKTAAGTLNQQLTVTYTPTTEAAHSATLTLSTPDASDVALALSGQGAVAVVTEFYVNAAIASPGDGSSWSKAMDTIPTAIGKDTVVYVAAGTYSPRKNIVVKAGGMLMGGYHATLHTRNYAVNQTIINGLNPAFGSTSMVTNGGVVDGFIIEKSRSATTAGVAGYNSATPASSTGVTGTGGGVTMNVSKAELRNCMVRQCVATSNGAGVHCATGNSSEYLIINCLIYDNANTGNTASSGSSAIGAAASSTVNIVNCTLGASWLSAATSAVVQGLNATNTTFNIYNTIIVPPTTGSNKAGVARSIVNFYNSTYFAGATGNAGTVTDKGGNLAIGTNPLLNADYTLAVGSPCIATGTTTLPVAPENHDLAYKPRLANASLDMGAYSVASGVWAAPQYLDFAEKEYGTSSTQDVHITPFYLTQGLTLTLRSGSAFTANATTVPQGSASQAVSITFNPTATLPGNAQDDYRDTLFITGSGITEQVVLNGVGFDPAQSRIVLDQTKLDFGRDIMVGTPVLLDFTLKPYALTENLTLGFKCGTNVFTVTPTTIDQTNPGVARTVTVTFVPTEGIEYIDTLVIQGSGIAKTIALVGKAIKPLLTADSAQVRIAATRISKYSTATVHLSATHLASAVALAIVGPDASMFALDSTAFVQPHNNTLTQKALVITYTPTAVGTHNATLQITSANATTLEIPLTAIGQETQVAKVTVNPDAIAMGKVPVGLQGGDQFILTAEGLLSEVTLSMKEGTVFAIDVASVAIPAGRESVSVEVNVAFAPAALQDYTDTVLISGGGLGQVIKVAVSGTGAEAKPTGVETETLANVQVYPTKVANLVYIQGLDADVKVEVYNVTGALVLSKQIYQQGEVDMSSQPNGLYVLKITTNHGHKAVKLVK